MKFPARVLSTFLVVGILMAFPVAAVADTMVLATAEEAPAEEAPADEGSGVVPAEEAPAGEEESTDQPWTTRFLAPTVLAIGILTLVGAILWYAFRIRGRYEVVGE